MVRLEREDDEDMKLLRVFPKGEKYLWIPLILTLLVGLTIVSVPVKSSPEVRVYVKMTDGYIAGTNASTLDVEVWIDSPPEWTGTVNGIVGWSMYVHVDPTVLQPLDVTSGGWLYDFCFDNGYYDHLPDLLFRTNASDFIDIAEFIQSWEIIMVGAGGNGHLCTLTFAVLSETAYTKIDLYNTYYYTTAGGTEGKVPVDAVDDGHYNPPPPVHSLTVESTPIDGIDFTIDLDSYTTNATVELEEGSYIVTVPDPWMVGMDQYNFVEWEDASTNPARSISLTSEMTIVATYELQVVPPEEVRVYVKMLDGYIPGTSASTLDVEVWIDSPPEWDNTVNGIVGWTFGVHVDPAVLHPLFVTGASSGYWLYDFCFNNGYYSNLPQLLPGQKNASDWPDIAEYIFGWVDIMVGAGGSGKLCTLTFAVLSEIAYTKIDLYNVYYYTTAGGTEGKVPVDVVDDAHYNEPPPLHNLTVESTPIDGIDFTVDSGSYTTNATVELAEGSYAVTLPSTWTVGTEHYKFVEWEDASTNPVRSISLISDMTVVATYELYVPTTLLSVYPPASAALIGETFTINVTITDVSNLYAWEVRLNFDPDVVQVDNATEGPFLGSTGSETFFLGPGINNDEGFVRVGGIFTPPFPEYGVTGDGDLATIVFSATSRGVTTLEFDKDQTQLLEVIWNYTATPPVGKTEVMPCSLVDGFFDNRNLTAVADVNVNPDALNVKSKSKWITAHVELPEGYNVGDSNVSTILLNDTVPAESSKVCGKKLIVRFDGSEVIAMLPRPGEVELTVTGTLFDGTKFEGSDTIRVIGQ